MTREEALKKVRQMSLPKETMEILEALAPELAESEDERIEDEILKFFCHCIEEEHIYVPTRFFDWLKKQKEQEHICDSAQYEEGFKTGYELGLRKQEEQKPAKKHDIVTQLREHFANTPKEQLEAEWKELEKWNHVGPTVKEYLGGIKPVEWSEEDSDNLKRIDNYLWMLDDYVCDDCAMPQGKTDKIIENIQEILLPWIKSLPERFNLQPKEEWSDEDEANRTFILESLEDQIRFCKKDAKGAYYTKQIQTAQNWLKSLSLNLKKKNEDVAKLCSNE